MLLRLSIIIILATLLITPNQVDRAMQIDADPVLISEEILLSASSHIAYNFSCQDQLGYYGSVHSSNSEIKLAVIQTSLLPEYLSEEYTPEYEWHGIDLSHWEFPCTDTNYYSFVIYSMSSINSTIDIEIIEDRSPPDVEITYERVSLYYPKYNVSFSFTGGFFSHASISLPYVNRGTPLNENNSLVWNAYYYNSSIREYIVLVDGIYNFTIITYETMNRVNHLTLEIKKTSGSELSLLLILISCVIGFALCTEWIRRKRISN